MANLNTQIDEILKTAPAVEPATEPSVVEPTEEPVTPVEGEPVTEPPVEPGVAGEIGDILQPTLPLPKQTEDLGESPPGKGPEPTITTDKKKSEPLIGRNLDPATKGAALGIAPEAIEEQRNILGRTKERFAGAFETGKETLGKTVRGEQDPVSSAFQTVGAFLGATSGTVFDALISGVSAITPAKLEEEAKAGVKVLGKAFLETQDGKDVLSLVESGIETFEELEEEHPTLAANLEASGQVLEVFPAGTITKLTGKAVKGVKALTAKGVDLALQPIKKGTAKFGAKLVESIHGLTKSSQQKFKKQAGVLPGEWLQSRGIIANRPKTIEQLGELFLSQKKQLDEAIGEMAGKFKDPSVTKVLDEALETAKSVEDKINAKLFKNFKKLDDSEGLTANQIQTLKRWYERNVKLAHKTDLSATSAQKARSTNRDNNLREFLLSKAEEQGLPNMKAINKEIQGSRFLIDGITGQLDGSKTNNLNSLTDYILFTGSAANPSFLAALGVKKVLGSGTGTALTAKALSPKPTKKPPKIDIERVRTKAKQIRGRQ